MFTINETNSYKKSKNMKNKKEFVKREVVNPLFLEAVDMISDSKQVIADNIGKTTMIFSKTKNLESTPALETLGALRMLYGLNLNALIDNDKDNLFTPVNYMEVVKNLEKEVNIYRERAELFERLLKKENFPNVDMSNQFADNIEAFDELSDVKKSFWIGQSFYKDLAVND